MRDIKKILLFMIFLNPIMTRNLFSVEFVVENAVAPPPVPEELPGDLRDSQLGFPTLHWIGENSLLYKQNPIFWLYDIHSQNYSSLPEVNENLSSSEGYGTIFPIQHSEGVLISYGGPFNRKVFYYSDDSEVYFFKDDSYLDIIYNPSWKNTELDQLPISFDWEYKLFGDNFLVPRPVYAPNTASVSLRAPNGQIKKIIPGFEARNIASYAMTALRSDKFKLAIFIAVVQETESSSMKIDPRIYLFSITYAGSFAESAQLHEEPDFASPIITSLPASYEVQVSASQNFIEDSNGREDYWYYVTDGENEGWVFGGKLLIEGENWEGRLASRGRPFDLDAFLAEQNENEETNAEEEKNVADDEVKADRSSFSAKRNSEAFHRILIITLLSAITLTLVISLVGSKMKKTSGQTSDSESP